MSVLEESSSSSSDRWQYLFHFLQGRTRSGGSNFYYNRSIDASNQNNRWKASSMEGMRVPCRKCTLFSIEHSDIKCETYLLTLHLPLHTPLPHQCLACLIYCSIDRLSMEVRAASDAGRCSINLSYRSNQKKLKLNIQYNSTRCSR